MKRDHNAPLILTPNKYKKVFIKIKLVDSLCFLTKIFKVKYSVIFVCIFIFADSYAQQPSNLYQKDSISKTLKLGEVTVMGKRKYFKIKSGKYILQFKGNPFFKGKSIAEALNRSPMISNQDDKYNIIGKESTIVYIDGRPSTMTGSDLYAYLSSKQAEEVDHIEIMTNSSAKFDANNKSGIINIVMKKESRNGIMTTLGSQISKGNDWKYGANGMLAYKNNNLSFNLFANGIVSHMKRTLSKTYDFSDNSNNNEHSDVNQKGYPVTTKLSVDYNYNKNSCVGVSYTLENLSANYDELRTTYSQNNIGQLNKLSDWRNYSHKLQFYNDNKLGSTTMSILYNLYFRKNNLSSDYKTLLSENAILQSNSDKYILNNAGLDFSSAICSSFVLSYGIKGTMLNTNTRYSFDKVSNNLEYEESTGAIYLSGEKSIGALSMNVGLRYEITNQKMDNNKKVYRNIFPYIYISHNVDKTSYFMNLTRSIDRPPYMNLTMSPIYFSQFSWTIGNPSLVPAITNTIELGANITNLDFKVFGKYIENEIFEYSYKENSNFITSFKNLKSDTRFGVNINWVTSPLTFAQIVLSATSSYDYTKYDNNETTCSWNNYIDGKLAVKLDKKGVFDADISYWHLFPQQNAGVKWKNRSNLSLAFNCNLMHNKLKLSLKAKDIFNQDIANYSHSYSGVLTSYNNTFDRKSLTLSASYMFGNGKRVRKNKNISVDEISRIPTE